MVGTSLCLAGRYASIGLASIIQEQVGVIECHKGHSDPLLAYKKPELVVKFRAAYTERDQIKRQAQAEVTSLEQRYATLLQAHMQCGITIAKLEVQGASYGAFMERFRSSLQREEYS